VSITSSAIELSFDDCYCALAAITAESAIVAALYCSRVGDKGIAAARSPLPPCIKLNQNLRSEAMDPIGSEWVCRRLVVVIAFESHGRLFLAVVLLQRESTAHAAGIAKPRQLNAFAAVPCLRHQVSPFAQSFPAFTAAQARACGVLEGRLTMMSLPARSRAQTASKRLSGGPDCR